MVAGQRACASPSLCKPHRLTRTGLLRDGQASSGGPSSTPHQQSPKNNGRLAPSSPHPRRRTVSDAIACRSRPGGSRAAETCGIATANTAAVARECRILTSGCDYLAYCLAGWPAYAHFLGPHRRTTYPPAQCMWAVGTTNHGPCQICLKRRTMFLVKLFALPHTAALLAAPFPHLCPKTVSWLRRVGYKPVGRRAERRWMRPMLQACQTCHTWCRILHMRHGTPSGRRQQ